MRHRREYFDKPTFPKWGAFCCQDRLHTTTGQAFLVPSGVCERAGFWSRAEQTVKPLRFAPKAVFFSTAGKPVPPLVRRQMIWHFWRRDRTERSASSGPLDRQLAQQIRIDPVLRVRIAGARPLVDRRQPHFRHQPPHPVTTNIPAKAPNMPRHLSAEIARRQIFSG